MFGWFVGCVDRFADGLLRWRNEVKTRVEEGGVLYAKKYEQLRSSLSVGKSSGVAEATHAPTTTTTTTATPPSTATATATAAAANTNLPPTAAPDAVGTATTLPGGGNRSNTPVSSNHPSKRNSAPAAPGKFASGKASLTAAVEQVQQQLVAEDTWFTVPDFVLAVMNGDDTQHRSNQQPQPQLDSSDTSAQAVAFEWLVNSFLISAKP